MIAIPTLLVHGVLRARLQSLLVQAETYGSLAWQRLRRHP